MKCDSAGWGVTIHCDNHRKDYYGPVELHITPSTPLKVERLSNNVAELLALYHALDWAMAHHKFVLGDDAFVIHYDSEYAYHMMTGRWKPIKNSQLIHLNLCRSSF